MWLAKRTQRAECPHTVKHYSTYLTKYEIQMPMVKCLECGKRLKNEPKQHCNYCREITYTLNGDCVKCGLSKTTPLGMHK